MGTRATPAAVSEGGTLNGIDLESYPAMAYLEFDAIVDAVDARECDRYPPLWSNLAGERIVLAAVAARRRGDAFAAVDFIMDFLKRDAPFWKRELHVAGDPEAPRWVSAKSADAVAAKRWGAIKSKVDGDE
jgi:molybdopterin synthase catalytic subunit